MKTYWDEEQERLGKERKILNTFDLLGRTYQIPRKLIGKRMQVNYIEPETLLQQAGYKKNSDRGWVKKIKSRKRFHAYCSKNQRIIEIHRDVVNSKNKHVADTEGVYLELERLRNLMPTKKPDMLSRPLYLKAMQELKQSKPQVSFFKKVLSIFNFNV